MIGIVLGLGYGDEGKGLMTDYLCSQIPEEEKVKSLVVRFNGGHQAGHTVQLKDGKRHVFSNFGSGTLQGVPTYWGSACTIHPEGIHNEFNKLASIGITPTLYINNSCPVTTLFDVGVNQRLEKLRTDKHGSCGVGFGTTLQREEDHYHLNVYDLNYPRVVKEKLKLISQYYGYKYDEGIIEDEMLFINSLVNNKNIHFVDDVIGCFGNYPKNIIYEGAQGILLDKEIGFFPHVTRSHTDMRNLIVSLDANYYQFHDSVGTHYFSKDGEVVIEPAIDIYYVIRAYATRHGAGPFNMDNIGLLTFTDQSKIETNVTNTYQGEFRKGVLDVDLLRYGIKKMFIKNNLKYDYRVKHNLVVTCMDHLDNPYPLRIGDNTHAWMTKTNFVRAIASNLDVKFNNLYFNETPYGNLIKI